jgi:hypothetical protein
MLIAAGRFPAPIPAKNNKARICMRALSILFAVNA